MGIYLITFDAKIGLKKTKQIRNQQEKLYQDVYITYYLQKKRSRHESRAGVNASYDLK
jgi:hypothetical protein